MAFLTRVGSARTSSILQGSFQNIGVSKTEKKIQSLFAQRRYLADSFHSSSSKKSKWSFSQFGKYSVPIAALGSMIWGGYEIYIERKKKEERAIKEAFILFPSGAVSQEYRRRQVDEIQAAFKKETRVVFLAGFGGVGKSSIISDYICENCSVIDNSKRYTGVIRINAIDQNTSKTSWQKIIEGMKQAVSKVKNGVGKIAGNATSTRAAHALALPAFGWFSPDAFIAKGFVDAVNILTSGDETIAEGKWLIVFDNVDSPQCVDKLFPTIFPMGNNEFNNNVDVIVSGRFFAPAVLAAGLGKTLKKIEVNFLDNKEEHKFFKKIAENRFTIRNQDLSIIFQSTLAYPFLLTSAATYCMKFDTSTKILADQLKKENSNFIKVLEKSKIIPNLIYPKLPSKIFDVYVEDLTEQKSSQEKENILKLWHTFPHMASKYDRAKLSKALVKVWGGTSANWLALIQNLNRHAVLQEDKNNDVYMEITVQKLIRDVQQQKWNGAWTSWYAYNPIQCKEDASKIMKIYETL